MSKPASTDPPTYDKPTKPVHLPEVEDPDLDAQLMRITKGAAGDIEDNALEHCYIFNINDISSFIAQREQAAELRGRREAIAKIFGGMSAKDIKALINKAEMMQDLISPLKSLERLGKLGREREVEKWAEFDEQATKPEKEG